MGVPNMSDIIISGLNFINIFSLGDELKTKPFFETGQKIHIFPQIVSLKNGAVEQ